MDKLAQEIEIDADVIYELKRLGITSKQELREKLKDQEPEPEKGVENDTTEGEIGTEADTAQGLTGLEGEHEGGRAAGGGGSGTQGRAGQSGRARQFVSYVAVGREARGDPDGLDQEKRMELESRAIDIIIDREPEWQRTPRDNPGFDLFKATDGEQHTWCEVKAMSGDLGARPVSLSRKQFRRAQKHGSRYWLYIVERADRSDARIVRIQDPAGKAQTFTFDKGWLAVAEIG